MPFYRGGPLTRQGNGFRRSIAGAAHDQRITEPSQPKPYSALGTGFLCLRFKREVGDIDDIVHHAHGDRHQPCQHVQIKMCSFGEGLLYQPCEIDRSQQASPIGRQGLFTTGICGVDGFAVGEIVLLIDPVDKNNARFSVGVSPPHNFIPEVTGSCRPVCLAIEFKVPRSILLNGFHKGVGDQNR